MRLPHFRSVSGQHPAADFADYRSTALRHPKQPLLVMPQRLTELTGPLLGEGRVKDTDNDLSVARDGEALGQRIIVTGQVLDSYRRPVPNTLIEIWQANAAGRYRHTGDNWPAPLDPHFDGVGRTLTDGAGRYSFLTVKPGAYPWRNHDNAWRPAHIHFSLFGQSFTQRLVTQMYFPDDPLFYQDPIFNAVRDARVRNRMIATYDHSLTSPQWALGFRWDIVLRGADRAFFETDGHDDDDL